MEFGSMRGGSSPLLRFSVVLLTILNSVPSPDAFADVVINEVVAANGRHSVDEDGDSSDWIELFNSGDKPVDLTGYGISDDPTFANKWTLPAVTVEPKGFLLIWASGKSRVVPRKTFIEAATASDERLRFSPSFVSVHDEWTVLNGFPNEGQAPEGWNELDFDDSSWATDVPGFELDLDPGKSGNTHLIPPRTTAAFLRRTFHVFSSGTISNLFLRVDFDDGFMAYLNGVFVGGSNFPPGSDVSFDTRATRTHRAGSPQLFDLSRHLTLLRAGENILALVALNWSPFSHDLLLVPELGTIAPILHTNFRLGRDGETVSLADESGKILDRVTLSPQVRGHSFGRFPDGADQFAFLLTPTPMAANDHHTSTSPISEEIEFSAEPGVRDGPFELTLSATVPFEGFGIRFTTDGRRPTSISERYTEPIVVDRDLVIRATGFLGRTPTTRESVRSYFVSSTARDLELPILSLMMAPSDFRHVHMTHSRLDSSRERAGIVEFFDAQHQLAATSGAGLRLHGGAGRLGSLDTKKAYRLYFRQEYGAKKLRYRAIPDTEAKSFDKLVLRSNINDAFRNGNRASFIRDQLVRDLHSELGGPSAHGSWYNFFVNGEYRGLYNVVERIDDEFFSAYFPEDGENWDVVRSDDEVVDGDGQAWGRMRDFFRNERLSNDTLYERALALIDVENFTNYMLLNIWAQNHDWPHNNWYAARPRRPDGKWIFLVWDAEFGIGRIPQGWSADTFSYVFSRDSALSDILGGLLQNPDYQQRFVESLEKLLEGPLAPANVRAHVRRLAEKIRPEIAEETALTGHSEATWIENIRAMEEFAENRNSVILESIMSSSRFRYLRLKSVEPVAIQTERAEFVRVDGFFFTPETVVSFETPDGKVEIASPTIEFRSSRELRVTVPVDARLRGPITVVAVDPTSGTAELQSALTLAAKIGPTSDGPAEDDDFVRQAGGDKRFVRGDVNGDGYRRLNDAVSLLRALLVTPTTPICADALDTDDSGTVNLTDVVVLLDTLFRRGDNRLTSRADHCRFDQTIDALGCTRSPACDG